MTDERFEARLSGGLRAYAEAGVRPADAYEVAHAILASGTGSRLAPWGLRPRWLALVLLGLLVAALTAGTLFVGSRLPTDPRVEQPVIEGPKPSGDPIEANAAVGAGPCAAMVQRLMTWGVDDPLGPIPEMERSGSVVNGDLLVTILSDPGEVIVGRLDASRVPPEPMAAGSSDVGSLPYPGFPIHGQSRIVASPDGRAVAVEQGDLGSAGCGDPLVLLSEGGLRRPFPAGSFELVADLAWAPDGSALYGVRRPTLDPQGRPFVDELSGEVGRGPGTVLRWDTTTGAVSDLGSPCSGCSIDELFVAPDGERLAMNAGGTATNAGSVVVREPDGTWRTVVEDALLEGWVDDESLVVQGNGIDVVALDGRMLVEGDSPCCHGTGYAALLSPDGTTLAGMTLSNDFLSWRVTLVDVREGTTREVWEAPDTRGCTAFGEGSSGRADCDATSGIAPDATFDPNVSISGYARVVAWAPDGSSVAVLDQQPDAAEATIRLVRTDGSGATPPVTIRVPDLSVTLGFPNIGPAVAWLPATP